MSMFTAHFSFHLAMYFFFKIESKTIMLCDKTTNENAIIMIVPPVIFTQTQNQITFLKFRACWWWFIYVCIRYT